MGFDCITPDHYLSVTLPKRSQFIVLIYYSEVQIDNRHIPFCQRYG